MAFAALLGGQTIQGIPQGELRLHKDGLEYMSTIEEDLGRAGYALTEKALVAGLRDPSPRVRSLAAEKIAREDWKDAVSSIMNALSVENDLGTQLWMANALARLGEQRGVGEILGICNGTAGPVDFRLTAAQFALELHNSGCDDMIADTLRSFANHETGLPPAREEGVLCFAYAMLDGRGIEFKRRSPEIRQYLEWSLMDNRDDVKMAAVNALGTLGDGGSVAKLRQALAAEAGMRDGRPDKTVKLRIQAVIKQLEAKEEQPGAAQR